MRKLLFGSLMILAASLSCNAGQTPESTVKLTLLNGRPVVDGVFLNGEGPFRFLLDTGAQVNQLQADLAHKLNLVPTFRVDLMTAAGTIPVAGAMVAEASLGSARAQDLEFLFTSLDGVHALSASIQGVLGEEFLAHFDYLLDLRGKRLTFGCASPAGPKIPLEHIEGRMAVRTSEGRMVLDSGADAVILFRQTASTGDPGQIQTASGAVAAGRIHGLRIQVAGRAYRLSEANFVPQSNALEDGLLPASIFRSIFVSNSGGYIVIEPNTGR